MASNLEYLYRLRDDYSKKMAGMIKTNEKFFQHYRKNIGRINSAISQNIKHVSRQGQEYKKSAESIKCSAKSLDHLRKKANSYFNSARKIKTATRNWERHSRALKKNETSMSRLTQGATGIGAGLIVKDVFQVAASFQQYKNRVEAVTQSNPAQMKILSDSAKKWGSETQFSAVQVMSAMAEAGQAGMKYDNILKTMPGTMALAASGQMTLTEAMMLSTDVVAQFGLGVEDNMRIANVLAAGASTSTSSVMEMGAAFRNTGKMARNAGVGVEELASFVMAVGDSGDRGEAGGTFISNFFREMMQMSTKTTKGLKKMFKGTGKSLEDFFNMKTKKFTDLTGFLDTLRSKKDIDLFKGFQMRGVRALQGAIGMTEEKYNSFISKISKSQEGEGAAKKMQEVLMKGLPGGVKLFESALEGLKFTMIESFVAPLSKGLRHLAVFMQHLQKNHSWILKLTFVGLGLVATLTALGIGLIAAGAAFKMLSTLTVLVTGPIKLFNILMGISTVVTGGNTMALKGNIVALRAARIWSIAVATAQKILTMAMNGTLIKMTLMYTAMVIQKTALVAWRTAIWLLKAPLLIIKGAIWLFNAALAANPIGLVVGLIFGLGTALFFAQKKLGSWTEGLKFLGGVIIKSLLTPINLAISSITMLLKAASFIPGKVGEMAAKGSKSLSKFQDDMNFILTGNKSITPVGMIKDLIGAKSGEDYKAQSRAGSDQAIEGMKQRGKFISQSFVSGDIKVRADEGTQVTGQKIKYFDMGGNLQHGG